ncbi:hypothetical protein GE09DRAFT_1209763 [Coniochaeta sp. 2T2.1]|nr:hypothetical protein GE09DRAFT_1209763 [Coniochaeta sp. 2T2.1]
MKVGDRVIIPAFPDKGAVEAEPPLIESFAVFGVGKDFGTLGGCQAEYVRAPFADKSLFVIENDKIGDNEFLFLTDIFPTVWAALESSGFQPGDDVTVFGAGPVGLLCAYSAILRGAATSNRHRPTGEGQVHRRHPHQSYEGQAGRPDQLNPNGTTRVCDCVGYECVNEKLKPDQSFVINRAVQVVSTRGGISIIGVYFAEPNSKGTSRGTTLSPNITFPITRWWEKSLTMAGGPVDTKLFIPILMQPLKTGRAKPSFIISVELEGIEDANEAYRLFDKKLETKIVSKFPLRARGPPCGLI